MRYKTTLTILLTTLSIAATTPALAKLYRWVDENGKVHYSDKVPPEHVKQARTELDERGLTKEQVERAKTPEEIAKQKEVERLRQEQQRLIEKQEQADNVLLRTFRSEEDIILARDGKLAAIDSRIQMTRSNIGNLKSKLAELQQIETQHKGQGTALPAGVQEELELTHSQLEKKQASILANEQEKEAIRKKYQADLERFRILKNLQTDKSDTATKEQESSTLDTVVPCDDAATCDRYWKQAGSYMRDNAVTPIQMLGPTIMMSKAPRTDEEYGITVSRIRDPEQNTTRIFFDLQCRETAAGRELCASEKVSKIRRGFRQALTAEAK
jgi:hypothetical protein